MSLRTTTAEYVVSEHGVGVGIEVAFPEERRLTGARMHWADRSVEVVPYPLDGTDPDAPVQNLRLAAGAEVLLEGNVVAPCPASPGAPVFEVDSSVEGQARTDRFRPDDMAGFDHAFFEWCRRPATINVTGSSVTSRGRYELFLEISNPGPKTVTVLSEAVTRGPSTWRPAQVDVPAGTIARLTVEGHGPPGCTATPPWETGHLLANRAPVEPAGEWC